jgi:hypothetical protein
MYMSSRVIAAALVLGMATAVFGSGTAHAQGLYPRNYALSCTGSACATSSCTASVPISLVGRLQLSSPIAGDGSVAVNADYGIVIIPSTATPFSVRIVNGTASEKSTGGNGIPVGCFSAIFAVPNVPVLSNTFGCYSDTEHEFDLVPLVKGQGTLSCHAREM